MAAGTFNSLGGAFHRCPIAEAHRRTQLDRRQRDYEARVSAWVARRFCGRSFRSLDEITDAAIAAAVSQQGRALSDEQHTAIARVCRALWCGVAEARHLGGVRYRTTHAGERRALTLYVPREAAA